MTDAAIEQGLSGSEAQRRLRELGEPPETSSRSVSSIVAGNVFTLFNLIIGIFFVLDLGLGLFADALFGVIAVINSYIGIRQELRPRRSSTSWQWWSRPRPASSATAASRSCSQTRSCPATSS